MIEGREIGVGRHDPGVNPTRGGRYVAVVPIVPSRANKCTQRAGATEGMHHVGRWPRCNAMRADGCSCRTSSTRCVDDVDEPREGGRRRRAATARRRQAARSDRAGRLHNHASTRSASACRGSTHRASTQHEPTQRAYAQRKHVDDAERHQRDDERLRDVGDPATLHEEMTHTSTQELRDGAVIPNRSARANETYTDTDTKVDAHPERRAMLEEGGSKEGR